MVDKNMISLVVDRLVSVYNPIVMYLFGSYAWGEPNDDSDLDILIIVKESMEKPYKRMKPAYVTLRDLRGAKDILVYTIEEFEKSANEPTTLFYKIKNQGVKLYEVA